MPDGRYLVPTNEGLATERQEPTFNIKKDPRFEMKLGGSFKSGFASDQIEEIANAAQSIYPGVPLELSIPRFRYTHSGQLIHTPDGGNTWYSAYPEGGLRGAVSDIVRGAGKAIPAGTGTIAGTAVGLGTAATGVGVPIAAGAGALAGAGGAAFGEVLRQDIGDWMLGGASSGKLNPKEIALESLYGAAGGVGGGATHRMAQGKLAKDFDQYNRQAAEALYSKSEKYGVPLTPAEATGLATLKAQQKRLGQMTATSNQMDQFYERRDAAALNAWNNFINSVSGQTDALHGGAQIRDAATAAYRQLLNKRAAVSSPLYEEAFRSKVQVNVNPIMEELDQQIAASKGGIRSSLEAARKAFLNQDGSVDTSVRGLHETKLEIDRMIENTASDAIGRTARRRLTDLQNKLVSELQRSSPHYKAAMQAHKAGSRDVDDAVLSGLQAISELKDERLARAASMLFAPSTSGGGVARTPWQVAQIRRTIEASDPEAWQAIKRVYLQDMTARALRAAQSGEVINTPGKLYAAFRSGPVANNMRAAMSKDEWESFNDLLDVFKSAASVRRLGSDTEWNRLINEEARKQAAPFATRVRGFVSGVTPQNFLWLKSYEDWAIDRNIDKYALDAVRVITSGNRKALDQIKEIKKLSAGSLAWRMAVGNLLIQSGVRAVDDAAWKNESAADAMAKATSELGELEDTGTPYNSPRLEPMEQSIQGRQEGGPVKKGKPYVVGENGPEIIVPEQDGMVIPNDGDRLVYDAKKGKWVPEAEYSGPVAGQAPAYMRYEPITSAEDLERKRRLENARAVGEHSFQGQVSRGVADVVSAPLYGAYDLPQAVAAGYEAAKRGDAGEASMQAARAAMDIPVVPVPASARGIAKAAAARSTKQGAEKARLENEARAKALDEHIAAARAAGYRVEDVRPAFFDFVDLQSSGPVDVAPELIKKNKMQKDDGLLRDYQPSDEILSERMFDKPESWDGFDLGLGVSEELPTITWEELSKDIGAPATRLPVYDAKYLWGKNNPEPMDDFVRDPHAETFIVIRKGQPYLINTGGFNHASYVAKLPKGKSLNPITLENSPQTKNAPPGGAANKTPFPVKPLDLSKEAKSKRANDLGYNIDAYHWSPSAFNEFEQTQDIGFHFGTKGQAIGRAVGVNWGNLTASERLSKDVPKIGHLKHYRIRMHNPYRINDGWQQAPHIMAGHIAARPGISGDAKKKLKLIAEQSKKAGPVIDGEQAKKFWDQIADILQDEGYDGMVYKNTVEGHGESYIVFRNTRDPSQIRFHDADFDPKKQNLKDMRTENKTDRTNYTMSKRGEKRMARLSALDSYAA